MRDEEQSTSCRLAPFLDRLECMLDATEVGLHPMLRMLLHTTKKKKKKNTKPSCAPKTKSS